MTTAKRRRTTWAIAASAVAHAVVLVMAVTQRPAPPFRIGEAVQPPEQVIHLLLMPRSIPDVVRHAPPTSVIRLHRPPIVPPEAPAAPIAPPAPPAAAPAPAPRAPVALHPSPLPPGPKEDLRAALRQGFVGCANRQAVGLNRAEREHCDERLGRGAKDTAFAGLGLNPEKLRRFDAASARKEADYRYKHSQIPGAVPDTAARPGETAEQLKQSLGVAGHTAVIPF